MGEGYLIRTQKMRGELSQGLLLPMSLFPGLPQEKGADVTALLGVRKWEVEERATAFGTIIANLPPEVPHTDETRVQSSPDLIAEFGRRPYYITTKMDGSSHSVTINHTGKVHVTGHNYEYADDGKSSFFEFLKKNGIIDRLDKYIKCSQLDTLTIQGELCAPGIQGNPVGLKSPHWFVFTVIENGERAGMYDTMRVCRDLDLEMVPIEEHGRDFIARYPTVENVLARADESVYTVEQRRKAEGIVIRPIFPCYSPTLGTYLSMKAVSNKYLLKKKGA